MNLFHLEHGLYWVQSGVLPKKLDTNYSFLYLLSLIMCERVEKIIARTLCFEGFFLSSVEYRVKIVEYRVNLVEYRVKIVEYRVKLIEYRVNFVEYRVNLVVYRVNFVEYRVNLVEYRVKII